MKKVLISALLTLIFWSSASYCQESTRSATWFPKGNLYPTILINYKENQISGSLYALHASGKWQNRVFGNFSLGLRSNIVRWQHAPRRASELGFELAAFAQFIFEDPFGEFKTSLFNVEFNIGVHYQYQLDRWRFRGRIYHISSHLGDDYIFRNGINDFIDNFRIYEVVDISAAWVYQWWQLYGTAGMVVHSAYPRKPAIFQTGMQFKHPIGTKNWLRWVAGTDLRFEQEQNFRPGLRVGAGIGIGKKGWYPLTIMVDYYNGYLPFSLYDKVLIQWIGASLWYNPFRSR